jgi:3-dehydroquinate synthase
MPLKYISLTSNIKDYTAYFEETTDFVSELTAIPNSIFVIDSNVWKYHQNTTLKKLETVERIILPISEEGKVLKTVEKLYDAVMRKAPKRNLIVCAIGGGITQDIVGFFASTLYRGITWIFVPTTLIAQADSCIGGKTSLNYKKYKNLIGTFYPPAKIYIYPGFLETQDKVNYNSGLGEVVKLYVIGGKKYLKEVEAMLPHLLKRNQKMLLSVVGNSLLIKKRYIEEDEFDMGRRNILNYGHCMGHALESVTDFAVTHGEAVVVGMMFANIIAEKRGLLSNARRTSLERTILKPLLPANTLKLLPTKQAIVEAMKQDKKRTGADLTVITTKEDYTMTKLVDVTEPEALEALTELEWECN